MEGLNWQTIQLALAAGMNQKADSRALQPPEFTSLIDAQFEEIGGIQTRKPWETATGPLDIAGGGTITADDQRTLVENGGELLLFTKDALYSRNVQQASWVLKGTHLAAVHDETPRFITTGDQTMCDRAELDGTIVYCWVDNSQTYCAAIDKESGGVLVAPTQVSGGLIRPRLVALDTKILLFALGDSGGTATGFFVRAIDPADPATGIASAATTILANGVGGYFFDICKVEGSDAAAFICTRFPPATTSHEVGLVTAGLSITQATKVREAGTSVAIACNAAGTRLAVIRYTAASVDAGLIGDILNAATLADVSVDNEITNGVLATTVNVTAVFHPTQVLGEDVCYVYFGEEDFTTPLANGITLSTIDTAGSTDAGGTIIGGPFSLASHAFVHDGHIYVNVCFAGVSEISGGTSTTVAQLQNTIFLFRDDLHLVGKALTQVAAGYGTGGHLPGVAATGTNEFSWCATERRLIPTALTYADRGPRDVVIRFDTNEARRCVRLGQTLYITGAEVKQYDGAGLYEVGFHLFPYYFESSTPGSGSLSAGTYAYKVTLRWQNARGETERSTTATIGTVTTTASDEVTLDNISPLTAITHKGSAPAVEAWRTVVDPGDEAPFYLVTSNDPATTSGDNCYLGNAGSPIGPWTDSMGDTDATTKETNPENGAVLEALPPPPATLIAASADRLFLAGVANDPDRVWYSKQRNEGEIAAFNDALTVAVPQPGGDITAIVVAADGTPIVFRETAIYVLLGDGYDNAGQGQNYVARLASPDIGAVSQEAVVLGDAGVYFKSRKGWRILNRAFQVANIGDPVTDYDSEDPLAVVVMKAQNQIRVLTSSRMLVLDTLASEAFGRPTWAEWSVGDGVHACLWNGVHVYLSSSSGLKQQRSDYTGVDYGMDVETAWIKFNDLQGFARLRRLLVLGEFRSSHTLRIRLARDYQTTYFQDKTWTVSPTVVGGPLQVKHGPSIQQMQAIKIRLTATSDVAGAIASAGGGYVRETDTFILSIEAADTGDEFNGNTLELVADGTGAGTFEDGAAAVFHYESGVTTVADLIVAAATSDYIGTIFGFGTINHTQTYTLAGGVDASVGSPNGEALKLTGLGLEVGFKRGLRPNLPTTQRQ